MAAGWELALALALALAVGAGAGGCSKGGPSGPPPAPPTPVDIRPVGTAEIEDRLSAVGTIEANESVEVKVETPGRVAAIRFEEGQPVREGDVLFELDAAKERAQLAQAEAEAGVARQNLDRARKLIGTKAIAPQELDQLASQVAAREATRQLFEARLKDLQIVAPFAGVVGPRRVSVGQFVDSGQSLVTLVDSAQVKISYRIPERTLSRFRLGQDVRLKVGAYPEEEFRGVVDLISPVVDPATRMLQVRARVTNPDGRLKPGMFARVETVVARRAAALVIPEAALVPTLEGFSVYAVREGQARLQAVELGVRGRGNAEIAAGLTAGQPIVVLGTQKLVDGMAVVALEAAGGTNRSPAAVAPDAAPVREPSRDAASGH